MAQAPTPVCTISDGPIGSPRSDCASWRPCTSASANHWKRGSFRASAVRWKSGCRASPNSPSASSRCRSPSPARRSPSTFWGPARKAPSISAPSAPRSSLIACSAAKGRPYRSPVPSPRLNAWRCAPWRIRSPCCCRKCGRTTPPWSAASPATSHPLKCCRW